MPQTTKTLHPKHQGLELTFTEADHRYFDNEGRDYVSVTSLLHDMFEPFDSRAAAERVAKREGRTVEDVIAGWERKRDAACDYGTRCHELAEAYLTKLTGGEDHTAQDPKEEIAFEAIRLACIQLEQWFDLIACEQVLFSPELKVAGTSDLLMQSKCGRITYVLDWKTNERHAMSEQYWQRGLGICANVPDNSIHHYAIQLSTYEELLRSEGHIDPHGQVERALIWIEPFCTRPRWLPMPYMPHAAHILNTRKA